MHRLLCIVSIELVRKLNGIFASLQPACYSDYDDADYDNAYISAFRLKPLASFSIEGWS